MLLGDEIDLESLTQLLLTSEESHLNFLIKNTNLGEEIKEKTNFKLREKITHFERNPNSLSRTQGLTEGIPMPHADNSDNIIDPEEEDKRNAHLNFKEQQRLEYEEAIRKDIERQEKEIEKEKEEKEKERQIQKEKDEIDAKIEESKNKLESEPEEGNPEAAIIQIRLADGN